MATAYRFLIRAVEIALILVTLALAAIVPLGVFFRYALNSALSWTDEIGGFLLVWITFLGAVVALDRGVHLDMDLLVHRLPPRARTAVRALSDLALAVLLVVILVNGWTITTRLLNQTAVSLPISRGLIQGVMPLSAALMLIVLGARWALPGATTWHRRQSTEAAEGERVPS